MSWFVRHLRGFLPRDDRVPGVEADAQFREHVHQRVQLFRVCAPAGDRFLALPVREQVFGQDGQPVRGRGRDHFFI